MAKRLQFCTALLLSMSVLVTGCTVDVQDPNEVGSDTSQPGDPSTTTNSAPVIELMGDSTITIPVNTTFSDPGVVATDEEDGDLTNAVYSNSMQVNTSRPGQYEITYRVTDSGDVSAQPVKRIVIVSEPVVEPEPPVVTPEEPAVEPSQPTVLVPAITSVKLVGFTSTKEMVELSTLNNGSVVDLSQTSIDLLNVVADSADVSRTGSVHFKLSGPVSVDRWENNAIYTMVVDSVNLSVSKSQLPVGDYSLTVTPYSSPDMGGTKGVAKTVAFKVTDKKIVSTVPKIAAVDLVSVTEATGDFAVINRIVEGAEIDLGSLPGHLINVVAVSEDASKTGSVQFSLNGPVEINRAENSAAYTLANDAQHIDISKNGLPAGDYTLVATPYAGADATGEAGIPLLVNFSVVGEVAVPEAPVVVPDPVAKADSYTFNAGSDAQPGQVQPVSSNDTFESGAVYAITKAPSHGRASMFDMGFFTYTPDSGYSGSDTFTYQVTQAGKTSSASVSINVVAPATPSEPAIESSTGFTVIKPSADSKLIYVSSSTGSDANTCLSQSAPCKTISAGLNKMRNGYPDHLYLKRGDRWRGERLVNLHSGRSASEPAVITYYGTSGARPKIENDASGVNIYKGAMKNFSFIGLEFSAYKMDPANPDFTGDAPANITLLGGNENILFEDNKFSYAEMIIQAWDGGVPTNIALRRNIWNGAYYNKSSFNRDKRPSNLYADGVVGLLIEENVFDHGGWHPTVAGAGANQFNHNLYIQKTVDGAKLTLRNNIITRASSHGAQMRSGGVAEDNFFGRNSVGLLVGLDATIGTKSYAKRNVISEGGTMVKGDKACSGANLCTRAVWGLHMEANDVADYQAVENIVSSRLSEDSIWNAVFSSLSVIGLNGLTDSRIKTSGNVEWSWVSQSASVTAYSQPGRTLADYNASIGGSKSFDGFMNVVLDRPLHQWDEKYTAAAVNDYIRKGFGMQ